MRGPVRTAIGCTLLVLAFAMLAFWLYAFALTAFIAGAAVLLWKRAPEPLS